MTFYLLRFIPQNAALRMISSSCRHLFFTSCSSGPQLCSGVQLFYFRKESSSSSSRASSLDSASLCCRTGLDRFDRHSRKCRAFWRMTRQKHVVTASDMSDPPHPAETAPSWNLLSPLKQVACPPPGWERSNILWRKRSVLSTADGRSGRGSGRVRLYS